MRTLGPAWGSTSQQGGQDSDVVHNCLGGPARGSLQALSRRRAYLLQPLEQGGRKQVGVWWCLFSRAFLAEKLGCGNGTQVREQEGLT